MDDDGHAGPNGCGGSAVAAKRIQKAVDASDRDDIVLVCPGTYRERVEITDGRDGLTLRGTDPWKAKLLPPLAQLNDSELEELILLDGVNNVTVRGLKLSAPNEPDCRLVDDGINVLGSRNARILGNQIQASPSQDPDGMCGYGYGIVVNGDPSGDGGAGSAASALVAHNLVANFLQAGIVVGDDSSTTATVTDNAVHYYRYQVRQMAAAQPAGGFGNDPTGILVTGGAAQLDLNVIQSHGDATFSSAGLDARPALLAFGIQVLGNGGLLDIRKNEIRHVFQAIVLDGVDSDAKVDDNVLRGGLRRHHVGRQPRHPRAPQRRARDRPRHVREHQLGGERAARQHGPCAERQRLRRRDERRQRDAGHGQHLGRQHREP